MKALLVEDDRRTAAYVRTALSDNGFDVEVATDGSEAVSRVREGSYGIVILDVMLPRKDGWHVLEQIRKLDPELPVVMLTARDSVEDRVRGLELGADDYLIKPFAVSELIARMRSIFRRGAKRSPDELRVADLELDPVAHRAVRGGKRLDLSPKEFALLSLLVRRCGEVLSRALIAEQVWDLHFDPGTNFVDVHIRRLRAKVDEPFRKKLIHTVRGVGYTLRDDGHAE